MRAFLLVSILSLLQICLGQQDNVVVLDRQEDVGLDPRWSITSVYRETLEEMQSACGTIPPPTSGTAGFWSACTTGAVSYIDFNLGRDPNGEAPTGLAISAYVSADWHVSFYVNTTFVSYYPETYTWEEQEIELPTLGPYDVIRIRQFKSGRDLVDRVTFIFDDIPSPTEETTEVPETEEPTTEDPTEDPTDEPTTEDPTDEPTTEYTTEDATDEPTTEYTTEDPSDEQTEDPTGDPTDEPTTEYTTEDPTDEPTSEYTTEDPTDEPTTEDPTEDPTDEPTTEDPTNTPSSFGGYLEANQGTLVYNESLSAEDINGRSCIWIIRPLTKEGLVIRHDSISSEASVGIFSTEQIAGSAFPLVPPAYIFNASTVDSSIYPQGEMIILILSGREPNERPRRFTVSWQALRLREKWNTEAMGYLDADNGQIVENDEGAWIFGHVLNPPRADFLNLEAKVIGFENSCANLAYSIFEVAGLNLREVARTCGRPISLEAVEPPLLSFITKLTSAQNETVSLKWTSSSK